MISLKAISQETPVGQVINIATGNKITLNKLLSTFCEIKQVEFNAEYQDPRQGDIKESYANVSKAAALLGWNSTVEFTQGLRSLLET